MKKITNIMMAVLLSTATITACAGNNTPETKKETVGLQMVNSWALQTGIQYYL